MQADITRLNLRSSILARSPIPAMVPTATPSDAAATSTQIREISFNWDAK
jgi:hypothetical protein